MTGQGGKPGAKRPSAGRRGRGVSLGRLRRWAVPALAVVAGLAVFVVRNIGALDDASALTIVGGLALVLVLFYGLRGFGERHIAGARAAALAGFTLLWAASAFYPFYRTLNPGAPLLTATLTRTEPPVTLPLRGKPGRYNLIVEGHFAPAEGRQDRAASFRLLLGQQGAAERVLEGTFSQQWRNRRVGAGRRSSLIPTLHQTTQVREIIDDSEGRDLTLRLGELSPGVSEPLTVRLYSAGVAQWLLIPLWLAALAGAVLIDAWRPSGASEGLMATLTLATFVCIAIFRSSSAAVPGFPQFGGAALGGAVVGALGGGVLLRITRWVRRSLARDR